MIPLLFSLMAFGFEIATAATAQAQLQPDADPVEQKAYWQNRYRDLRSEAARLRREFERERELYADANRRNYRRGPVRHEHREKAAKAEQDLARVEAELAGFSEEARRKGALPGWLYEVEDEPIEITDSPPEPEAPAELAEDEDDGGRNPLYLEKDKDQ